MKEKGQTPRVLLTGFTAFPGVLQNPCVDILQGFEHDNVSKCLLSVSYAESVLQLDETIAAVKPDAIVELGVSKRTKCLKLELHAYNLCDASIPDVSGAFKSREAISESYPLEWQMDSTMDVHSLLNQMKSKGVKEVYLSTDPGRYVCNHLYFYTLTKYSVIPTIFVHIPMLTEKNHNFVREGLSVLVDCLVEAMQSTLVQVK